MLSNPTDTFYERDLIAETILKQYQYGSSVYGTKTEYSDIDYIAVVDSCDVPRYSVTGEIDYTVYSEDEFIRMIELHNISVLECIFQSEDDEYLKYFKLNSEKLRREISSVSSNSYGKAKKKIYDGEIYIGKKSLFHSIRILMFGIQIAEHGTITDYSCANHLLTDILNTETWNELHLKYKPLHNQLKSEFKKLAPLEGDK